MTILLAILGAVLGALLGAVAGFFGYIAIGTLLGVDDQQGALAMGAAMAGGPLGLVIGAIAGCLFVLLLRRRRGPSRTTENTSAPLDEGPLVSGQGRAVPRGGWVAITLVIACVAAFLLWFFDDGTPPVLRKAPVLVTEIRLPADDPGIDFALSRGANLRNHNVYHSESGQISRRESDGFAILSITHRIAFKTDDRSLEIWAGYDRLLIFDLNLPKVPVPTPDFSEWHPVSHVRAESLGPDLPQDDPPTIHFRTRVLPPAL